MPLTAFQIADAIERRQHLFGKLRRFAQNCGDDIGGRVGEARKVVVALDMKDVVEQELYVVDWRLIGRHRFSPGSRHDPKLPGPCGTEGTPTLFMGLGRP